MNDTLSNGSSTSPMLMTLHEARAAVPPYIKYLYPGSTVLSLILLAVIFVVYILVPELRHNFHGRCVMCHVMCLFFAQFSFAVSFYFSQYLSTDFCVFVVAIIVFWYVSAWAWMAAMSLDIYRSIRKLRLVSNHKSSDVRWKFFRYSVCTWSYGIAVSSFLILMNAIVEKGSPFEPHLTDYFMCWFNVTIYTTPTPQRKVWAIDEKVNPLEIYSSSKLTDEVSKKSALLTKMNDVGSFKVTKYHHPFQGVIYYYVPACFMLTINIVVFILTIFKIKQVQSETAYIIKESGRNNQQLLQKEKQRFNVYAKLFTVMGICFVVPVGVTAATTHYDLWTRSIFVTWALIIGRAQTPVFFWILARKRNVWKTIRRRLSSSTSTTINLSNKSF